MCFLVRNCLFCVSLEKATKIIGHFYLVCSSMLSLLFPIALVEPYVVGGAQPLKTTFFYSVMALLSVVLLVASCYLIYAEFRKNTKLMWPWVITAWCTSVCLGVFCVIKMVNVSFRASSLQLTVAAERGIILAYFTHAVLLLYCACVVNSRRIQLKEEGYAAANNQVMCPIMHTPTPKWQFWNHSGITNGVHCNARLPNKRKSLEILKRK